MSEANQRAPMRALIVEDDASWQKILAEILSDMGLAVDMAASVDAAAVALRSEPHRLAVVDLSLEESDHTNRDGLAVLDAVKRLDPGCIAVLLTGFATVELAVSALTAHGAFTCLRKETFRRAEFRLLVQQALAVAPRLATEPGASGATAPGKPSGERPTQRLEQARRRILIVEDDAGWRSILGELLADMGHRIWLSASYGEALGRLRRQRFDLAIVDLRLASSAAPTGNQDGYRVLANTHAAAVPTIVVSGAALPLDIERAYAEYNIRACLEKQAFDRQAFRRTVEETLAAGGQTGGSLASLTERERDVLKLLAQGMTNRDIAAALVISTNTVKRHLKAIFAKLGVSTRAAATAKAISEGISESSQRIGNE